MRTLRRLGVATADLEDLAHDVFLAVHQQLHSYDAAPTAPPVVVRVRVPHRLALPPEIRARDGARPRRARHRHGRGPRRALEKERRRRLVLAALDQIELSRRAVFVLHELDGCTCEEIARALDIPIGTSYSRLRLARQDFTAAMTRLQARRAIG